LVISILTRSCFDLNRLRSSVDHDSRNRFVNVVVLSLKSMTVFTKSENFQFISQSNSHRFGHTRQILGKVQATCAVQHATER